MTRVGITGATGFIGGALVPHLGRQEFDLCLVDNGTGPLRVERKEWPMQARDYTSDDAMKLLSDCDVVLHLGAVSGVMVCADDPVGTAFVNVEGTRRLIAACAARGVPVAFASSLAVVGAPERMPVTEETPARPTHEYARQKAAGEQIVADLGRSGKAATAVLRMSNVYGGYSVDGRAVGKDNVLQLFARQSLQGRLTVNAPGTQRRDFVHLQDVLAHWEAAVRFLVTRSPTAGPVTFNVASGETFSVLEIANKVASRSEALHPGSPPIRIDLVPNPRKGVELVEPEFVVSRAGTERMLRIGCRYTVNGTLDELLAAAVSSRRS